MTALESEGIFRESGSASRIQHIDSLLFKGESISGLEENDLHAMCGLLKRILREMPDQLFSLNADDKARFRDCIGTLRATGQVSNGRALNLCLDSIACPQALIVDRRWLSRGCDLIVPPCVALCSGSRRVVGGARSIALDGRCS